MVLVARPAVAQVVYVVINAGPEHSKGLTSGPEGPDDSYHSTEEARRSCWSLSVKKCSQSSTSLRSSRPVIF